MPLTAMLAAAGVSAAGSAWIGSSSAKDAANQAALSQYGAESMMVGGQQSAVGALEPYAVGGNKLYDMLQYYLTGNMGTQPVWGAQQQADLDAANAKVSAWQSSGSAKAKEAHAGEYAQDVQTLNQLTQQKQQADAYTQAQSSTGSSGLPAGYLSQPFNLNTAMQSGGSGGGMVDLSMQEIAAQRAASGGFGSGNQATDIANYISGTFQPEMYAEDTSSKQNLYNMLTGNTGGAGQSVATNEAGIYSGTGTAQYAAGAGSATAAGTLGQSNAYTNALTGVGNTATGTAGLYLNYQNQQAILNALKQNSNPSSYLTGTGGMSSGAGTGTNWSDYLSGSTGYFGTGG
jgi:hypothetical protein